MRPTLTAPLFDIVVYQRVHEKHCNMWTDMLEMDIIYILNDWN